MNTIPSKYHSQIKKLIKKDREEAKAEIIKMIEEMQSVSVTNMESDVKCSWVSKDDIIKELRSTKQLKEYMKKPRKKQIRPEIIALMRYGGIPYGMYVTADEAEYIKSKNLKNYDRKTI